MKLNRNFYGYCIVDSRVINHFKSFVHTNRQKQPVKRPEIFLYWREFLNNCVSDPFVPKFHPNFYSSNRTYRLNFRTRIAGWILVQENLWKKFWHFNNSWQLPMHLLWYRSGTCYVFYVHRLSQYAHAFNGVQTINVDCLLPLSHGIQVPWPPVHVYAS